jgi:UDP:flavonoid glycosyltransferase YjiC (YdhE family)
MKTKIAQCSDAEQLLTQESGRTRFFDHESRFEPSDGRGMRIGIVTWGSQGDVRPFLALAEALSKRGHRVDLVVSSIDESDYSGYPYGEGVNLSFTSPLPIDRETLDRKSWESISDRNPVNHYRFLMEELFDPLEEELIAHCERLCTSCDVVVKHLVVYPLSVLSERHGIPLVDVSPTPVAIPAKGLALPGIPWTGRTLNGLLWKAASLLLSRLMRERVNGLRQRFGLDPVRDIHGWLLQTNDLTLLTCSPTLMPDSPGWLVPTHMCGRFRFSTFSAALPMELERFLSSGPPPLYVTMGSMMYFEPEPDRLLGMMADAILKTGQRGILQCDGYLKQPPIDEEGLLVVGKTPHAKVFPRCRAVVHHGGSGTTHTVVENGLPSVVVMYGVDQLFWGPQLHRKGLAPKPLLRRKLTTEDLASAIDQVCGSQEIRSNAQRIAGKMHAEKGTLMAAELIESLAV